MIFQKKQPTPKVLTVAQSYSKPQGESKVNYSLDFIFIDPAFGSTSFVNTVVTKVITEILESRDIACNKQ